MRWHERGDANAERTYSRWCGRSMQVAGHAERGGIGEWAQALADRHGFDLQRCEHARPRCCRLPLGAKSAHELLRAVSACDACGLGKAISRFSDPAVVDSSGSSGIRQRGEWADALAQVLLTRSMSLSHLGGELLAQGARRRAGSLRRSCRKSTRRKNRSRRGRRYSTRLRKPPCRRAPLRGIGGCVIGNCTCLLDVGQRDSRQEARARDRQVIATRPAGSRRGSPHCCEKLQSPVTPASVSQAPCVV